MSRLFSNILFAGKSAKLQCAGRGSGDIIFHSLGCQGIIVYLEYQSVCPIVGIGTPPPSSESERVSPLGSKGGSNTLLQVMGWGELNSDDWILHAGGPSSVNYFYFWGMNKSSEAAMGGGRRVAPRLARLEPKKTGARSARARTRGQNPLVNYKGTEPCMSAFL